MLGLFLLALLLKILDNMVFRLDERFGELIVSKLLGFGLVVAYVWACGRKLRDIGFHIRELVKALAIALIAMGGLILLTFGTQLIALRVAGVKASIGFAAVDPKTGMSGGLLFGLWLFLSNFVNSAMEEGLFRGLMLRHFRIPYRPWGAILLQALLFALWHLNWPVKHLLMGGASVGEAAAEAGTLLLGTAISGIVYGYMYHKTDNLWAPYVAHTINNTFLNVMFIRTAGGLQSAMSYPLFLVTLLVGNLLMLPLTAFLARRWKMPEVEPWGEFA
jgi:membrane protease YdiL (CAAX protease family)